MTRLALALTVLAAGLVSVDHTETSPTVPSAAPSATKHRHAPHRASRSMRRHRLASKPRVPAKAINSGTRPDHLPVRPPSSDDLRQTATLQTVTAYCATGNRNAAGNWPTVGTAAANAYPLGTVLHVQSIGNVTVEDRSAIGATQVDIFLGADVGCPARAAAFGRRSLLVQVAA